MCLALCTFLVPISSAGSWVLLGPIGIVVSYFAGRHLQSRLPGILAQAIGATAAGMVLLFSAHLSIWGFLLNLMTSVLLFVFLPWFIGSARRQSQQFAVREAEQLRLNAAAEERNRIATQMHDQLGHDLALLALQASALQVSAPNDSPIALQAAGIRRQADTAVENLHNIIGILRHELEPTFNVPISTSSADQLIHDSRAKGMHIEFSDLDLSSTPESDLALSHLASQLLFQCLRESLTNAAKYAPDSGVLISASRTHDGLEISLSTKLPNDSAKVSLRQGTGLATLHRFFEQHHARLHYGPRDDSFVVEAIIPTAPGQAANSQRQTQQRPSRHRLATTLVPLGVLTLIGVGFFALQQATFSATALPPAVFAQIAPGMKESEVKQLVSAKGLDSPTPIIDEPPIPGGSTCRFFAARSSVIDFSNEMYRLCFDGGTLVSKEQLFPLPQSGGNQ